MSAASSRRTDRRYGSPRWRKLTRAIQRRDLFTCQYCGRPSQLTDHVIRADVAPDLFWEPMNLVACCRSCNQGRRQNGDAWIPPNQRQASPGPARFTEVRMKPRVY